MKTDCFQCADAIIEQSPDAAAVALLLRKRGLNSTISECSALDEELPPHDLYVADCWSGERTRRIQAARRRGSLVTSIGELVMRLADAPTIGVTGTAGKTETTHAIAALLEASAIRAHMGRTGRAENAWPTGDLLSRLPQIDPPDRVLVELTSTHLCFMQSSPQIAVVTNIWPDHIELHGSYRAYRAAKRVLLEAQGGEGIAILNADDPGSRALRRIVRGQRFLFSGVRPVRRGVGVERGRLVARLDGPSLPLGPPPDDLLSANAAAAVLAALLGGAHPEAVRERLRKRFGLALRRQDLADVHGVRVVNDGMAATPRKALASLAQHEPSSLIVIAGGRNEIGGVRVHAAVSEQAAVRALCDALRAVSTVVLFGTAAGRVDVPGSVVCGTLAEARGYAFSVAQPGQTVLFAPGFPCSLEDRKAFASC